jgi:fatty-acyl-CoA synthase
MIEAVKATLDKGPSATGAVGPWAQRPSGGGWADLSPIDFLLRSADVFAERPAVRDGERAWTYAELLGRVEAMAGVVSGLGVGRGDRVAVLLANAPEMLEAHFAVPGIGAVLVPLNSRLAASEIAWILEHCGARVLITDAGGRAHSEVALAEMRSPPLLLDVDDESEDGYASRAAVAQAVAVAPQPETTLLSINYTSGTTGKPKGVTYTHRGAYLQGLGVVAQCGLSATSKYLWTLPMFHCHGWAFTWAVTAAGGEHVCLRQVVAEQAWTALRERGITHFCGAPTVLTMLLGAERRQASEQLVKVFTGGAPPSPDVIQSCEALGWDITHLYGLTETYGPIAVCVWDERWDELPLERRARLKARQGMQTIVAQPVRVVDEQLRDVPRDGATMGEIVVSGNNVTIGYFESPEETERAFAGGAFHSGDLAVMHPDGYVEIKDRSKDVIISGGENISSIEVEQALSAHPDVLEVAVIGTPDEKWGETPHAFVVPQKGAEIDGEQLREFARGGLASYKLPGHITFLDELPTTSTGKVQKFRLRELDG